METLYTGIIALAGTLLGSITTYVLQRRMVAEQMTMARSEKLRNERLASCSAFAAALTDLKRAVVSLWFQRQGDPESKGARVAWIEADRFGAAAEAARFNMLLLLPEPTVERLANDAFDSIEGIGNAKERADLIPAEQRFSDAVKSFIESAAVTLR
jgi:hypothetical protein